MLQAIDLFCGAGGLSCGLRDANFHVALGVDIDTRALTTYQTNFRTTKVLCEDVYNLSVERITQLTGLKCFDNFLLAGCPPCQGFSSLGKRDPYDEKNQLVYQYVRLVSEMKPSFLLMENVPGMSKSVGKKIFSDVISKLEPDYILEYATLNAADYGVPQIRKRLVLHGIRKDIYNILSRKLQQSIHLLPEKTHCDPALNTEGIFLNWETVGNTILDLPEITAGEMYPEGQNDIFNHRARNLSELNLLRLSYIREHGGSRKSLPDCYSLDCHRNSKKGNGYGDTYGVIDPNKPSPTMTTGCTNITKGRFGHPFQNRGISLREAARLQSFSDDFVFVGNLESISLQIGNAVPPQLARASADKIYYYMTVVENILNENNSTLVS